VQERHRREWPGDWQSTRQHCGKRDTEWECGAGEEFERGECSGCEFRQRVGGGGSGVGVVVDDEGMNEDLMCVSERHNTAEECDGWGGQ
jgi:hypothetical protein